MHDCVRMKVQRNDLTTPHTLCSDDRSQWSHRSSNRCEFPISGRPPKTTRKPLIEHLPRLYDSYRPTTQPKPSALVDLCHLRDKPSWPPQQSLLKCGSAKYHEWTGSSEWCSLYDSSINKVSWHGTTCSLVFRDQVVNPRDFYPRRNLLG